MASSFPETWGPYFLLSITRRGASAQTEVQFASMIDPSSLTITPGNRPAEGMPNGSGGRTYKEDPEEDLEISFDIIRGIELDTATAVGLFQQFVGVSGTTDPNAYDTGEPLATDTAWTAGANRTMDRFRIGQTELEVTQIGKKCHGDNCAIFREIGKCVMPQKGIFARVITNGTIKPADTITLQRKVLNFWVITLSDRASAGQYPDRSGPAIEQIITDFFKDKGGPISFERCLIADDAEKLKEKITAAAAAGADAIFTTGGTGIGPRDITVDVVSAIADKTIPGIMEHIRVKYGSEKPNALLSRSVAAVKNKTLIYTLPGSVKAVGEYTPQILKTIEHCIYTLNGLDLH